MNAASSSRSVTPREHINIASTTQSKYHRSSMVGAVVVGAISSHPGTCPTVNAKIRLESNGRRHQETGRNHGDLQTGKVLRVHSMTGYDWVDMVATSTRIVEYYNPISLAMPSPSPNASPLRPHNLALVCAFLSTGSIFVAFMTSPLIFNFPAMNSRCACVLPATILPKSSSDSDSVTAPRIRTSHSSNLPWYWQKRRESLRV